MKRIILSVASTLATAIAALAQTFTTYLPQIAAGSASGIVWNTHMTVTNPAEVGTSNASVTITFTKSDGTPFNVTGQYASLSSNGMATPQPNGSTLSFQLSGGQSRFFLMDASAPLAVGFASVTSSAPVTTTSVFVSSYPSGDDIGEAGVSASCALSRQSMFVLRSDYNNTAIAYANPNPATASVTFQLYSTDGVAQFAPVTRTLSPNNQASVFITDLFPTISPAFVGTVRITTSDATPLSATTLLLHPTGQFGALPVVPLP